VAAAGGDGRPAVRQHGAPHAGDGTVFNQAPDVLAAAIAGLRDLPLNLVVTTLPGVDPAGFAPQPPHVLVASYIPHALLLPRCRLVVSQGGAGILFAALGAGLPQLVLPQGADQTMNADACREAGAGLSLAPDEVTAEAVRDAAIRLLADPGFAAAARLVRTELDVVPGPSQVLAALSTEMC
jgi:MGT family glycosyltransferase